MILVFALYALLASTFTIGKILLFFLPPLMLIALRMTLAGVLLLTSYFLFFRKKLIFTVADWLILFAISLIHIFIPYATEFIALQHIVPSCAALMYNLSPFFTALFSYLVFQEKMTKQKWIGFALGIIGVLYFIQPGFYCWNFKLDYSYFLVLISVASAAFAWVAIRYFVKKKGVSILFINGMAMLLGGFESFIASKVFDGYVPFPWEYMKNFLFLLVLIILIANVMFYNLYGYLLKKYTATFLSFVGFITPLFTALFDWILLDKAVHASFFVSVVIVGFGIYIFYKEELKQKYIIVQ